MLWLKNTLVDIAVTIFIGFACWLNSAWMWWIIAVYSILMILAKAAAIRGEIFVQQSRPAPDLFFHILYAVDIILLIFAHWWYLVAGWILIWLFSYLGQRKSAPRKHQPGN
jgi:hypothetical protein